jgi:hypothetical protein
MVDSPCSSFLPGRNVLYDAKQSKGGKVPRAHADQAFVACDLILYLLLLKEKEDNFESYGSPAGTSPS